MQPRLARMFASIATLGVPFALVGPAAAAVQVAVTAGPHPITPGELANVEITVTNDGPSDRSNVTVTMAYPTSLDPLWNGAFDGNCPGSYCEPTELATFSIPLLQAGKGVTFTVPPRVLASAPADAVIPFNVTVIDDAVVQATGSTELTVAPTRLLNLECIEHTDPVQPGSTLGFTLTYGVRETSSGAAGALLALPLPIGTTLVSASHGGALVGNEVRWSLGNLAPGAVGERTVTLAVSPRSGVGDVLSTEAVLSATGGHAVAAQTATRVEASDDLRCAIVANPDPARPGELVGVEITIANAGFFDRSGVVLEVWMPDHFDALWNGLYDGACPGSYCEAQEFAFFNVGTVRAGEGVTFAMPLRVTAAALDGAVLPIDAVVRDVIGDVVSFGTAVAVHDPRILNLAVADQRDPVAPGESLPYTLTYGVRETSAGVAGATLSMPLPPGTSFVSASDGGTVVNGAVQWTLGNLGPGTVGERSVVLDVADDVESGRVIRAEATLKDSSTRFVLGQSSTRVEANEDLELAVIASPDSAMPGEQLAVEVTVANDGPFDRTGVTLVLETAVGSSRVDLQACKLEYSIVSPK